MDRDDNAQRVCVQRTAMMMPMLFARMLAMRTSTMVTAMAMAMGRLMVMVMVMVAMAMVMMLVLIVMNGH